VVSGSRWPSPHCRRAGPKRHDGLLPQATESDGRSPTQLQELDGYGQCDAGRHSQVEGVASVLRAIGHLPRHRPLSQVHPHVPPNLPFYASAAYQAEVNGRPWLQWNNTFDVLNQSMSYYSNITNGVVVGQQNAYSDALIVYNLNPVLDQLTVDGSTVRDGTALDGLVPIRPFAKYLDGVQISSANSLWPLPLGIVSLVILLHLLGCITP